MFWIIFIALLVLKLAFVATLPWWVVALPLVPAVILLLVALGIFAAALK